MAGIFLTAEWRSLLMLNYRVEPATLERYCPAGLEIDLWEGRAYVSVVGFLFLQTRLLGIPIPFHRDFPEVNLRFYVRRRVGGEWRRGVVFIKEIVPRRAIATVARLLYGERYVRAPMRHSVALDPEQGGRLRFEWQLGAEWEGLGATALGALQEMPPGSEAEFIFEHYWGYARQPTGLTVEYEVRHPRWRVWEAAEPALECDAGRLYGSEFAAALSRPPDSAFIAEGSPVEVRWGAVLPNDGI